MQCTVPVYTQLHNQLRLYCTMFVHTGKVFAILAAADNAVPIVSGVLYTQVYNATISSAPAAIFWVTFASQICVFTLIFYIHVSLGGRSLEDATEVNAEVIDPDEQH